MLLSLMLALALAREAQADPVSEQQRERLHFLESRIEAQRAHAALWWKGWLSFYTAGMLVQGVRAATATEAADRADLWISFAKATGGVIRLAVDPYQGIQGVDPGPRQSRYLDATLRLKRAEQILASNAERTTAFGPWYAHVINFGVNGLGGVIVGAGFDAWQQGMISAAIGFGFGELMLLTAPWEADGDLEDYERRFERRPVIRVSANGVSAQLRF